VAVLGRCNERLVGSADKTQAFGGWQGAAPGAGAFRREFENTPWSLWFNQKSFFPVHPRAHFLIAASSVCGDSRNTITGPQPSVCCMAMRPARTPTTIQRRMYYVLSLQIDNAISLLPEVFSK